MQAINQWLARSIHTYQRVIYKSRIHTHTQNLKANKSEYYSMVTQHNFTT